MLQEASNIKRRQFSNLLPRRFGLNGNRIHIYGPPKSGKTSVALSYSKNFKNPFYIDLNDLRNNPDHVKNALLKIAMEKKVDCLIIDNINMHYLTLPNVSTIITISEYEIINGDFSNKNILPLSFEEFISFDSMDRSINDLLNTFITNGNLPITLNVKESHAIDYKQQILSMIFKHQLNIFIFICRFQGKIITINQLYHLLKKDFKISKDSIYATVKDWQDRGILYFVSSYTNPNLPKKVFFWDFSIVSCVSYNVNILTIIENMLFLELLKLDKKVFYDNKINLICDGTGYIISLFSTVRDIEELLSSIDFLDLNIVVITLDYEGDIQVKGRSVKILNFISFALGY